MSAELPRSFPLEPAPPAVSVPAPPPRSRMALLAWRAGKVALYVLAGYYVLAILLLLVFRFVDPPFTGLQVQRRVESWFSAGEYRAQKRYVPLSRMPAHVPRAIVAAEDGRFYRHWGFDFEEMRLAGEELFDGERLRGASTITQQLMKNLFGCACRNPIRKVYDLALTPPAELILGKERIIELYLNNVEWGPGIFGIDAAARYHYRTSARSLSRWQAAGLAALLPNPFRRTPRNTPQYRSEILRRMSRRGW